MRDMDLLYTTVLNKRDHKELLMNLSSAEIETLIDIIICNSSQVAQDREALILQLALYTSATGKYLPKRLFEYLLKAEYYNNPQLYMRADEEVASELITRLEHEQNSAKKICMVECIAAIPCEASINFIRESSTEPLPSWAEKLYTLPNVWTTYYGWHVNQNNEIEKLYSEDVLVFQEVEDEISSDLAPLKQMDENCQYCGYPLTLVYDKNEKLATCLFCSCYETIFVKQEKERIKWHGKNHSKMKYNNHGDSDLKYKLKVTDEKRLPIASINESYMQYCSSNQIGGMPTLVCGVVAYPQCPDCGKLMKFSAQYSGWEAEGIYYFFTCHDCGIHACNYNQT